MAALMSFEDEDHAEKRRQNAKARAVLRRVRHVLVGMDVLVSRLAIDTVHDNAGDNLCLRVEVQDICGHERVDVINAVDMAAEDFPYEIAFRVRRRRRPGGWWRHFPRRRRGAVRYCMKAGCETTRRERMGGIMKTWPTAGGTPWKPVTMKRGRCRTLWRKPSGA